jgi:hypothetical protein
MDSYDITIVPCDISVINRIGKFTVLLQNFKINTSVELVVSLFDIKNVFISTVILSLDGDDYTAWGTDDDYLVSFVCTKLGFQVKPPSPVIEQLIEDSNETKG